MKAYKVEIVVLDFEECGIESLEEELSQMDYFSISVKKYKETTIKDEDWDDSHPLNYKNTPLEEIDKYFK